MLKSRFKAPSHREGRGHVLYKNIHDFSPLPWNSYFQRKTDVRIRQHTPNESITDETVPEIIDYQKLASDPEQFNDEATAPSDFGPLSLFNVYDMLNCEWKHVKLLIVMIHGGGFSGLTWSLLAHELIRGDEFALADCCAIAIDLRGHGETETSDNEDLSLQTLSDDVASVINEFMKVKGILDDCQVMLVGHSLGGSVAVQVSHIMSIKIVALCVVDVVEGTAKASLTAMQSFLSSRPSSFSSLDQAILWSVQSGQIHNVHSARITMPSQLKQSDDSSEIVNVSRDISIPIAEEDEFTEENTFSGESIAEPSSLESEIKPKDQIDRMKSYTWRIDLSKTERFWSGWFSGLSQKFLSSKSAKLLLLAGVDRLDRELTVGQMQGKFQMQVLPKSGHAIHEDEPSEVGRVISHFIVRNKFASFKNV